MSNPKNVIQRSKDLNTLLERDNHRCGIHLGGCGKTIANDDEANIGHIYPQNLLRDIEVSTKSSLPKDGRRCLAQQIQSMPPESKPPHPDQWIENHCSMANVQPMHKRCNDRMGGRFPPEPGILFPPRCECCSWWFAIIRKDCELASLIGAKDLSLLDSPSFTDEYVLSCIRLYKVDAWFLAYGYVPQSFLDDYGRTLREDYVTIDGEGFLSSTSMLVSNLANKQRHLKVEDQALDVLCHLVSEWREIGLGPGPGVMTCIIRSAD